MEENTINKRKTLIFISAAVIIPLIFSYGLEAVYLQILNSAMNQNTIAEYNQLISVALTAVINIVTLIVRLVTGKIFTKDKVKTVIFAGSVYFAGELVAVVSGLVNAIGNIIMRTGNVSASAGSQIIFISGIVFSVLNILPAYYIYTALEKGYDNRKEKISARLPKVKRTALTYIILVAIVASAVTNGPVMLIHTFMDASSNISLSVIVSSLSDWLGTNVVPVLLLCLLGYLMNKSRWDVYAFGSAICFADSAAGILSSVLSCAAYAVSLYLYKAENNLFTVISGGSFTIISTVSLVVAVLIAVKALSYFYSDRKAKISEEVF